MSTHTGTLASIATDFQGGDSVSSILFKYRTNVNQIATWTDTLNKSSTLYKTMLSFLSAARLHLTGTTYGSSSIRVQPSPPPSVPIPDVEDFFAVDTGSDRIQLTWTGIADQQMAIERSLDDINYAAIMVVDSVDGVYVDIGLSPNILYFYRARHTDGGGNYSANYAMASATTQFAPPPPIFPSDVENFAAVATGSDKIQMTWTGVMDYQIAIERSTDDVSYEEIMVIDSIDGVYVDVGLNSNNLYFFRARHYYGGGYSINYVTASATTQPPPNPDIIAGLLGSWRFDSDLMDSSGNGNDFVATTPTFDIGLRGQCLTGATPATGSVSIVMGNEFSFSVWMFSGADGNAALGPSFGFLNNDLSINLIGPGQPGFGGRFENPASGLVGPPMSPDAWHHAVVTLTDSLSPDALKLYVDGVLVSFVAWQGFGGLLDFQFNLSGGIPPKLDIGVLYNRPLIIEEVAELYNDGSGRDPIPPS